MSAQRPQQSPRLRRHLIRLSSAVAVILATTLWYQHSLLPPTPLAPTPQHVGLQRQPSLQQERQLTQLASARRELPMVDRSIHSLQSVKQRGPEQERRLQALQARRRDLHRLEDYQLRLALHAQDSSRNLQALRLQIDHLSQSLGITSPATE